MKRSKYGHLWLLRRRNDAIIAQGARMLGIRLACILIVSLLLTLSPGHVLAAQADNGDVAQQCAGSIRTQVMLIDVYGLPLGEYNYTTDGVVVIQPPLQTASGQREANPFHLLIQSQPAANAPGEVMVVSATEVEGLLFPYWRYTRTGATVQGQLTDNHTAEAIAQNLVTIPREIAPNFWMPVPFAMANGTTLEGQVAADQVILRITGNTVDLAHPFRIDIAAAGNCMYDGRGSGGNGSSDPTPRPAPTA